MSQLRLLRSRRFLPLFVTQFFGAFNDNFFKNALVILITYKTTDILGIPSSQMVAVAGGIFILPFFLFSALSGQIADKYEKGKLIRIVKVVEIFIMILALVGFYFHQYAFLLAVLFLMGLHSTVFGPLKFSVLPQLLEESELVGGNALVGAGTFLSILLGTIAGGTLVVQEPWGPVYCSLGLIVVAVLGYIASRSIPVVPPTARDMKVSWNPITPTIEIFRFAAKTRSVFLSILGISWFWFFGAAFLSLFPIYCKDFLNADSKVVTLFLATFSIGIAIGAMFCERLSRQRLELGLVPLGSIGMTIFALDLGFAGKPAFSSTELIPFTQFFNNWEGLHILGDLLGIAIFSGLYIVPLNALIQKRTETSYRSRVIAANNVLNALFMVLASLFLFALLSMNMPVTKIFIILALTNAAVALYIYTVLPEFLLRFFVWILANLLYRLRVTGHENLPEDGPALLVCNHVSFVDWMIIGAGVKRPVRFVMHYGFAKFPFTLLLKQGKVIPIASAKADPAILAAAYEKIAQELRDGEMVCIFPEGKVTYDGKLNPFRAGVEKILETTPVPVIPMALGNLWGSLFSRKDGRAFLKLPRRFWARITLSIGKPIPPAGATAEMLSQEVAQLIEATP